MDGKEYKGHTKNKGISLEVLLLALLFHYTPELGGNQSRLLNSYIVYEFTASIPLPRPGIHKC